MSEEEKKVIEYFKKSFTSKTPPYWYDDTIENSEIKIKTLVNLIEKLKKENEDREQAHMKLYNEFRQYKDWDSIPKYKIREKIKELEEEAEICRKEGCENTESFDICCAGILKELLGED